MKKRALYIIPARGGSKGIPRKNIRLFADRPLIHYSIELARSLEDDSHVIVSTEDEEIANVARQTGLKVDYMRPAQFASDTAGSREVMIDVMNWADHRGVDYEMVVLLQPTSPLRMPEDVEGCIELYNDNIDMVVSVVDAQTNPYYNCFETDSDTGFLYISKGDGRYTRRQDAPPAWEYNGAVYVINPRSLRDMPMGCFRRRIPFVMPRERSVDIDTPTDWLVAEMLYNQMTENK